jgi:hypothetical protein
MWRMIVNDATSSVPTIQNAGQVQSRKREKGPTNRQVRKWFIYGKHISRRPVRRPIFRLEIVMRDKEIICVQTLR